MSFDDAQEKVIQSIMEQHQVSRERALEALDAFWQRLIASIESGKTLVDVSPEEAKEILSACEKTDDGYVLDKNSPMTELLVDPRRDTVLRAIASVVVENRHK